MNEYYLDRFEGETLTPTLASILFLIEFNHETLKEKWKSEMSLRICRPLCLNLEQKNYSCWIVFFNDVVNHYEKFKDNFKFLNW